MNIWRWVTQTRQQLRRDGHTRLAEIMERLPSLTCDDRHAEVEAMTPEGVALARQLELPWVEVFVRHWHLQSAILHQYEVTDRLAQAVELLDFAHQDHTRDCPQSVCTTQNLAVAYGLSDGPGYAQERLDVSRETLSRISPAWPCFTCISSEHANALIDRGDLDAAVAFLEDAEAQLKRLPDARPMTTEMAASLIHALLRRQAPGDAERALRCLETTSRADSDHDMVRNQLMRAHIMAVLGRREEAVDALPEWSSVMRTPSHYERAASALGALMIDPSPELPEGTRVLNTWRGAATLHHMALELKRRGVARQAMDIALMTGHLSARRGAPHTARVALHIAQRAAAMLRHPERVASALEQLARRLEATPPGALLPPEDPEHTLARLAQQPAQDAQDAQDARLRALLDRADALAQLGASPLALDELVAARERALDDQLEPSPDLIMAIHHALAGRPLQQRAALQELLMQPVLEDSTRGLCHWLLALMAREARDWAEARARLSQVQLYSPDQPSLPLLMAQALTELDDHEAALVQLDAYIQGPHGQAPGGWDWDRMSCAALLGRWSVVRDSARRLGWPLDAIEPQPPEHPDDPIEQPMELCKIVDPREPDRPARWARRLSPVTAQLLTPSDPGQPQRLEDVVVFDASPLNPPPEDHPEDEPYTYHYHERGVIRRGSYQETVTLDGVHPGERAVEALRQSLERQLGALLFVVSGDAYTLTRPARAAATDATDQDHEEDENTRLPGLYAKIALPEHASPAALHQHLSAWSSALTHPLVWPTLLRRLGLTQALAHQAAIMERYDITEG